MTNFGKLGLALALLGGSAAPALAQEEPQAGITVNGFASTSYVYNMNRPADDVNAFRVFDSAHDSFLVEYAEVVVQRAASNPGEAGFRVDFGFGATVPPVTASRGLFRDPMTGAAGNTDLQQAFVTYIFDAGKGLRLDLGKFITSNGAEVIPGHDGYNMHHSNSYLFGYAIPFTHTGLRVSYPFSDKFAGTFLLVNGWNNVIDNNPGKTFGVSAAVTPTDGMNLYLSYHVGPEQDDENGDWRNLFDLVFVFSKGDLTLMANFDFGHEAEVMGSESAVWWGFAGHVRYALTDRFALALRGEHFVDADGFRTGMASDVTYHEVTFTPELKLGDAAVLRGDLRLDHATEEVFTGDDPGDTTSSQLTVSANALFFL